MDALDAITGRSALVVIAHPDDESFGLGGVVARLIERGWEARVVCFTHGEASTLGRADDLADLRGDELRRAAQELGVAGVNVRDLPDGHLVDVPPAALELIVEEELGDADLVVVFEPGGVTGHADHRVATAAAEAVAARRGLAVLEWGVAGDVAEALNREFGTTFSSFGGIDVTVDRDAQWRAICCHDSQARDNPVVRRRLELQGGRDRVRVRRAVAS